MPCLGAANFHIARCDEPDIAATLCECVRPAWQWLVCANLVAARAPDRLRGAWPVRLTANANQVIVGVYVAVAVSAGSTSVHIRLVDGS